MDYIARPLLWWSYHSLDLQPPKDSPNPELINSAETRSISQGEKKIPEVLKYE